jgi:hypothetical protein
VVWECTSTCYVLFWIVIVPACDHKNLFVERVTKFTKQSTGQICLAEYHAVSQFCGYSGQKDRM